MKLTIESDEGVKNEYILNNCWECPISFMVKNKIDCPIEDDIAPHKMRTIPDSCPFKKKEKKMCCLSMTEAFEVGFVQRAYKSKDVIHHKIGNGEVVVFYYCPWCGKKIELE